MRGLKVGPISLNSPPVYVAFPALYVAAAASERLFSSWKDVPAEEPEGRRYAIERLRHPK